MCQKSIGNKYIYIYKKIHVSYLYSPIYDKENYFQPHLNHHHGEPTGKISNNYVSQNHLDQSMMYNNKPGMIHRYVVFLVSCLFTYNAIVDRKI